MKKYRLVPVSYVKDRLSIEGTEISLEHIEDLEKAVVIRVCFAEISQENADQIGLCVKKLFSDRPVLVLEEGIHILTVEEIKEDPSENGVCADHE